MIIGDNLDICFLEKDVKKDVFFQLISQEYTRI